MKELLKAEAIAENLPDKRIVAFYQRTIGDNYSIALGNFAKSMEWLIKSTHTYESLNDTLGLISGWLSLGTLYISLGDYDNALVYLKKTKNLFR